MAIILPANTLAAGGFEVANSCRFDSGDSAYIHQTPGGNGSNTVFTLSLWFKRGQLGTGQSLFAAGTSGVTTLDILSGDTLAFYDGGSTTVFITNRVFRDVSAWYHIALICNTGESGTDQCKLYINGVLETSFSTDNRSSLDAVNHVNQTVKQSIGQSNTGSQYIDGYLAEIVMLDGTATAIGNLGEYDSDSPTIWKPIDVSGLTFGTNGYYLDFEDSSNLGNNAGSGSADFTEVNLAAADQATDTPTNNFCTLNPLDRRIGGTGPTFAEGNNMWTASSNSSSNGGVRGSLGVSSGKYYFEVKAVTASMLCCGMQLDSVDARWDANGSVQNQTGFYGIAFNGEKVVAGSSTASVFTALSNNDIIGFAFDLDNNKFFARVNDGAWFASGNPETGANTLGTLASGTYLPAVSSVGWSTASSAQFNFGGSPAFTVSSGNADGNGYGNFEYAVPTGYFALCTKNLAEYG